MAPPTKDVVFDNFAAQKQTFIIPLTFTDVNEARDMIARIGYGGDVWELRVDLLRPLPSPLGETNLPPREYVEAQVKTLRSISDHPILFTIRTKSQGGKFPDDASQDALDLMLLAIAEGIEYLDVDIEWPQSVIDELVAKRGSTKIVASYHSWTGEIRWTSKELRDKFASADNFGDIIKLSILSTSLEDCYELGLFVRDYRAKHSKPILAVGMGAFGQLSRVTSPISLVTHPLIPFPSAPGQLSLAQVHQARHLLGQLPQKKYTVNGHGPQVAAVANAIQAAFSELGYPHYCEVSGSAATPSESTLDISSTAPSELVEVAARQFTLWTGRPAPLLVLQDKLVRLYS
ncbi:aldolase [Thozetella sp. PMI_491]|nr:aldolase [Thozetella sp. PMI_491]